MIKLSVKREDLTGPWIEIGLTAGQYNLRVDHHKKSIVISCVGVGDNGSGAGKVEITGDEFENLIGVVEQSRSLQLAAEKDVKDA